MPAAICTELLSMPVDVLGEVTMVVSTGGTMVVSNKVLACHPLQDGDHGRQPEVGKLFKALASDQGLRLGNEGVPVLGGPFECDQGKPALRRHLVRKELLEHVHDGDLAPNALGQRGGRKVRVEELGGAFRDGAGDLLGELLDDARPARAPNQINLQPLVIKICGTYASQNQMCMVWYGMVEVCEGAPVAVSGWRSNTVVVTETKHRETWYLLKISQTFASKI